MLVAVVSSFFGGLPGWISHFAGLKLGIISRSHGCGLGTKKWAQGLTQKNVAIKYPSRSNRWKKTLMAFLTCTYMYKMSHCTLGLLCASQCCSHAIKCGQTETVASLGIRFKQSVSTLSAPVTEQQGKREREEQNSTCRILLAT